MKNIIFILISSLFLLVSCERSNIKIIENSIEGTLQFEYETDLQEKIIISEFDRLETASDYTLFNNNILDGTKAYTVHFISDDGRQLRVNLHLQRNSDKGEIEELEDGNWKFKTIDEQLEFFNTSAYGYIGYRDARLDIRDEELINRSKIIETKDGPAILVDFALEEGKFYGKETIYSGSYYYDEYFRVYVDDFRVQFVVDLESF